MYRDLGAAAPISSVDIPRFFKDSTFGVEPGNVDGVESPEPGATIVRDRSFGVPHIYGDTRPELMFAIGYATAEDRLFFIDVLRHLGRAQLTSFAGGTAGNRAFDLSEWQVAPYTESDLQRQVDRLRTLGPAGQRVYSDGLPYIAGINAYIAKAKTPLGLLTMMPGEYAAIGRLQGPDPFKPTDLISIAALVGGIFGQGGGGELANAQLLQSLEQRFGAARGRGYWRDFVGTDDPETPTTVQARRFPYQLVPRHIAPGSVAMPDPGSVEGVPMQRVTGGAVDGGAVDGAAKPSIPAITGLAAAARRVPHGSNALLVSARNSVSGHPLAVFGPQTGYFAPEILMEEDIHGPGVDAAGAAFPGVNLYVELGHGRDYAWSATSAGQDIIDTFALALCNPDGGAVSLDSTNYSFRGRCLPMERLERVNSWHPSLADSTAAGTETLTAYRTRLGLLVARARIHGRPVAYVENRSTYLHELDSAIGFERFNDPGYVHDARSWQRAASTIQYTFNWFYADSRHIAYFDSGANPVRPPGVDPRLPTSARFTWRGFDPAANTADYTPFSAHPQVIDQSYITSWNNKPAHGYGLAGSPVYRSQSLDDGIRAGLRGGRKMTLADLVNAMESAATVDLRGTKVLPFALQLLGRPTDPALSAAVAELRAWVADGAHRRSPSPGQPYAHADAIRIMDAWWPLLVRAEFEPVLGHGLFKAIQGMNELSNGPNNHGQHLGSAWQHGWYGYVIKDLRTVLGRRVRGRYSRKYCGRGSLRRCRYALVASLRDALKVDPAKLYADDVCAKAGRAGDQACFDSIFFRPLGAITQPLIPWQNRPTFQQVVEVQGTR
jgi:acyl-homoserine lactone acylase PvdQ